MTGPDLILYGGNVITVDPALHIAEAVAITADRITAIGTSSDVRRLAGTDTRLVDLRGRTVVPGLVDAHAHMDREGLKSLFPSLAGARSIDDVLQRIETLVKAAAPGDWIVTLPLVSIANSARHRAAVGWDTDRKGSGRRADMLHDWASDAVLSPLGIGFTSASCRAYMTMNGVISASVSAVSSQQVAKVTCTPHVIVPLGSAPIAIALVESSASRTAGTTIRNL